LTQTIWDGIESARERWNVLRHPFYRRWTAGELTAEELARYAGQYRHAVEAIATASEAVAAAAPERADLHRHAREEREHIALWDEFLGAAGGSAEAPPTPETAACASTWAGDGELLGCLVTLYAIESGQLSISRTKREGLIGLYGFAEGEATAYFEVHERRDVAHAAEARELLEELASDRDSERLAAKAEAAFRANWRLLDGV
jgi:pyrroloquinoline quinone (PQQ) biosynthesis protein C